jgi:hypothetical protein
LVGVKYRLDGETGWIAYKVDSMGNVLEQEMAIRHKKASSKDISYPVRCMLPYLPGTFKVLLYYISLFNTDTNRAIEAR